MNQPTIKRCSCNKEQIEQFLNAAQVKKIVSLSEENELECWVVPTNTFTHVLQSSNMGQMFEKYVQTSMLENANSTLNGNEESNQNKKDIKYNICKRPTFLINVQNLPLNMT